MAKSIYTIYKERLVEISGKSRSVFSKKGNTSFCCDLGDFYSENKEEFNELINNFYSYKDDSFSLFSDNSIKSLLHNLVGVSELDKEKIIRNKINSLARIKKEVFDIARETGRYELYIGYPFVKGKIGKDTYINAPLILFPVKLKISDDDVSVELIKDMPITLNKSFILAYAREKKLNLDDMNMELNGKLRKQLSNTQELRNYLAKFGIKLDIKNDPLKPFNYSINSFNHDLTITNHATLGRYSLANSIYQDYNLLESKKATTNEAIDELIYDKYKPVKHKRKIDNSYTIHALDYTQEKVIEKINNEGNVVVYGPPGTGKSQTIVNIISDALAKNKKVLIVSQKKAALDVVYNRLGNIKNKAIMLVDPEREKEMFYKRVNKANSDIVSYDCKNDFNVYEGYQKKIDNSFNELRMIYDVLHTPSEFGISLEKMYERCSKISKNSFDYLIYEKLLKRDDLLNINYHELVETFENITRNNRHQLFYKYQDKKNKNPIIDELKDNISMYNIDNAMCKIDEIISNKTSFINTLDFEYFNFIVAEYFKNVNEEKHDYSYMIKHIIKTHKKGMFAPKELASKVKKEFEIVTRNIKDLEKEYEFLKDIFTDRGYKLVINAIVNNNYNLLKNIKLALGSYSSLKDIKLELKELKEKELKILDFALNNSDNTSKYTQIIDNFISIRMYIEIVKLENLKKEELAKIMSFSSIKKDINYYKEKQREISDKIAYYSFNNEYLARFKNDKNSDFIYQISKQQNTLPIRKFMSENSELMLDLFPCWLLSPDTASQILPLKKNMFDLVLFDEASQVFIENTLPLIYRGKNIVVAGDSKQLKPTQTFMKRYSGADYDDIDSNLEPTLDVVSLLDLATSRLAQTSLNYHYRSKAEELIDFSNNHFYDGNLEVVPNLTNNKRNSAIKRVKVDGVWSERRNLMEAGASALLLKKELMNRKDNESIGIIAFNNEQANAIEEAIVSLAKKDKKFAELLTREQNRYDGSEDVSLFIKNIENVQGDERDIIILSVGYGFYESGKICNSFGSLSVEGGENRLNVAISRAKKKTYVVTSIEPEDLRVDNSKNEGPKMLKKYLSYVRAISDNKKDQARLYLNSKKENIDTELKSKDTIASEIKLALEELGYKVKVKVGNTNRKIDLAVYDKELNRYLLGIDCINKDYKSFDEMIEGKLYYYDFLGSRGWDIFPVWTRNWWINKNKVIDQIVNKIEMNKKEIIEKNNKKNSFKR